MDPHHIAKLDGIPAYGCRCWTIRAAAGPVRYQAAEVFGHVLSPVGLRNAGEKSRFWGGGISAAC